MKNVPQNWLWLFWHSSSMFKHCSSSVLSIFPSLSFIWNLEEFNISKAKSFSSFEPSITMYYILKCWWSGSFLIYAAFPCYNLFPLRNCTLCPQGTKSFFLLKMSSCHGNLSTNFTEVSSSSLFVSFQGTFYSQHLCSHIWVVIENVDAIRSLHLVCSLVD